MTDLSQDTEDPYLKDWISRIKECKKNGEHIKPTPSPLLYNTDKGWGYCEHCSRHYQRPLNSEERQSRRDLRRLLHLPFTI